MADTSLRQINVGRIVGLSSYELAVKHGFIGTELDYVNKEQEYYNKMVQLMKGSVGLGSVTDGTNTLDTTTNRTLNIETDGNIVVELDPATNTLKFSLSQEFLDTLAYKSAPN